MGLRDPGPERPLVCFVRSLNVFVDFRERTFWMLSEGCDLWQNKKTRAGFGT